MYVTKECITHRSAIESRNIKSIQYTNQLHIHPNQHTPATSNDKRNKFHNSTKIIVSLIYFSFEKKKKINSFFLCSSHLKKYLK